MSKRPSASVPALVPDSGPQRRVRARPLPRTPIALSVLNLLNERPMHPYEIRARMHERGHDRAFKIRESSVYDTVARLADRAFIEPVEVNRAGRRPERTVYAITEAGRDELLVWLRELTSEPAADYPAFAAPLMFIYALGREGAISALRVRAARLEAEISRSDAFRKAVLADVSDFPRIFGIEEEYAQAMRKAELAWVRGTVAELLDGSLGWPLPDELPGEGGQD
jgi:DNA-binding PadR family transcriptional regulator